ncbi:MAG: TerC family protein [Deltaproteobacteria bacterium]|nr:TerC family protein [Deltaproteobacteria bacterium]
MEILFQPDIWISLFTLTLLEIVLGLDNIVFLSILSSKLPHPENIKAQRLGLLLALVSRLGLLFGISWIMGLNQPFIQVLGHPFSGRDLILLFGGLFLIAKATHEIHDKLEVSHHESSHDGKTHAFAWILVQIILLDLVFSLDSVITAVGMASHIAVMVVAMVLAVGVMLVFASRISSFVERHPSIKMLALSFLLLIGVFLVADGMGKQINKGYIYFAMAFSLGVELLNMRFRKTRKPVALHHRFEEE